MAYVNILNKTKFRLHGALSWDSFQDWCFNDLNPGASAETNEFNFWQKDLTVVLGMDGNRFDPSKNGNRDIGRLALQGVGLLFGGAGYAGLAGLGPQGAAAGGALGGGLTAVPVPGQQGLWSLVPAPSGGNFVKLKGDVPFRVNPVTVTQLYMPDGYWIEIEGCEFQGQFNSSGDRFVVKKVLPLTLKWRNRQSGTNGTVVGTVDQTGMVVLD
jgi:hypothetical protein